LGTVIAPPTLFTLTCYIIHEVGAMRIIKGLTVPVAFGPRSTVGYIDCPDTVYSAEFSGSVVRCEWQ